MKLFNTPRKLFEEGCYYRRTGKESREFIEVFEWKLDVIKKCLTVKRYKDRWVYILADSIGWMDFDAVQDFREYFTEVKVQALGDEED